eukprot:scaffold16517_cov113-Isochrysis_galbana.AAC.5
MAGCVCGWGRRCSKLERGRPHPAIAVGARLLSACGVRGDARTVGEAIRDVLSRSLAYMVATTVGLQHVCAWFRMFEANHVPIRPCLTLCPSVALAFCVRRLRREEQRPQDVYGGHALARTRAAGGSGGGADGWRAGCEGGRE